MAGFCGWSQEAQTVIAVSRSTNQYIAVGLRVATNDVTYYCQYVGAIVLPSSNLTFLPQTSIAKVL